MKKRMVQILAGIMVLAAGSMVLRMAQHEPPQPVRQDPPPADPLPAIEESPAKETGSTADLPAPPAPEPVQRVVTRPEPIRNAPEEEPERTTRRRRSPSSYWERAEERFIRQWDRLDREQNQEVRDQLIQNMSRYVRMDTAGTIEWAMTLEDPTERRLALESINEHALSGIGARIAMDESGFPSIRETTVMSAVGATGNVQPGDYIVGMADDSGQFISFESMNLHQVIRHLRGEAGTDVHLYMERASAEGTAPFEVSVTRSLLVIQPPVR